MQETNNNNLYIIATPIGNMGDISSRAVQAIKDSELIIVENTPKFKKLCSLLKINAFEKKIIRFGDFNNKQDLGKTINQILTYNTACLVTEAGTPLISDPGFKIVNYIREKELNINIAAIPGPSALTAHLSISGLPTDKFLFIGFLPKSNAKGLKILESFKEINNIIKTTFVIYESKYKILKTLEKIHQVYPESKLSVGNELTKMYEKVYFGSTKNVLEEISKTTPKGEYVIHLLV